MRRMPAIVAAIFVVLIGVVACHQLATAATGDPCEAVYDGSAASQHAWEACRFDRIDRALGITPSPSATPSVSPSASPSPSPSPTDTSASPSVTLTASPTATSTPSPTATSTASALTWPAPALVNPVTVNISNSNHSLKLDPAKDYRLVMPSTIVDVGTGNFSINGGHNVVLVGGQLTGDGVNGIIRATNQSGTLHIEGLYISAPPSPRILQEGIQLQNETNATVQLQRIRVDQVYGTQDTHHADMLQWWGGGPRVLRIDGWTGSTNYQAFMMQAFTGDASTWDWRHINLRHYGVAGWAIFDGSPKVTTIGNLAEVYVHLPDGGGAGVYSLGRNTGIPGKLFIADHADFVPAGSVGIGYSG